MGLFSKIFKRGIWVTPQYSSLSTQTFVSNLHVHLLLMPTSSNVHWNENNNKKTKTKTAPLSDEITWINSGYPMPCFFPSLKSLPFCHRNWILRCFPIRCFGSELEMGNSKTVISRHGNLRISASILPANSCVAPFCCCDSQRLSQLHSLQVIQNHVIQNHPSAAILTVWPPTLFPVKCTAILVLYSMTGK